jgi:hypothetical protein
MLVTLSLLSLKAPDATVQTKPSIADTWFQFTFVSDISSPVSNASEEQWVNWSYSMVQANGNLEIIDGYNITICNSSGFQTLKQPGHDNGEPWHGHDYYYPSYIATGEWFNVHVDTGHSLGSGEHVEDHGHFLAHNVSSVMVLVSYEIEFVGAEYFYDHRGTLTNMSWAAPPVPTEECTTPTTSPWDLGAWFNENTEAIIGVLIAILGYFGVQVTIKTKKGRTNRAKRTIG